MQAYLRLAAATLLGVTLGIAGANGLYAQRGSKLTMLQHTDLAGVDGKEVYMALIDAPPGAVVPPHRHHGDEFGYVLDGSIQLDIADKATATFKAGDVIHIAPETAHSGKIAGTTPFRLLAVYIVDKGKPLANPVK